MLILYAVLSLTLVGNFVISAENVESFQVKAFNNEAFATARGLQTNLNSLIEKSFLPYTDIVNCESLLDHFVESNTQVLYTYTTDTQGNVLYTSRQAVTNGLSKSILANNVIQAKEDCVDDELNGILYYILPLQEVVEVNSIEELSVVGVLVVAYPRTCITEPLVKLYINNAILVGITFVLSFMLIFMSLTKWVTKPLQMLDKAIRKVSKKGFEGNSLDIISNDEIGQITQSFNDMLSQLAMTTVSKEYVDSILLNMSEALFVFDVDKHIEKVNDAALNLLGYSLDELQGQTLDFLYSKVIDNPYEKEHFIQCIESGISRNNEIEFINKEGACISLSVNWSVIKDEAGNVNKYVCTARDITELKQAQSIVMYQANYDQLTGLSNRYNLENSIEKILEDKGKNHFFIMIDLDKFKLVNDLGGHAAGDELLKQISFMLKRIVGEENLVARLGGDEFAVIMYDTERSQMTMRMEKLLSENKGFSFVWEGKSFKVGMSIGAYEINQDGLDKMAIMVAADRACYIAKMNGGNRLHIYSDADKELQEGEDEISMISILVDAFEKNRFFLEYEPMISLQDFNAVQKYEVLLHLQTKEGKVLGAGAFLSTAERYHKLCVLNQWIIHEFCRTYHDNKEKLWDGKQVQFHIDIFNETISSEQFCEFIEEELQKYAIPASVICFDIAEGDLISNFVEVAKFVKKIKEIGCSFCVDNIGYGMPSCTYLKNLPADIIKINGALINGMVDSAIDEAVVKSIQEIASLLNMQTVANEVDTPIILEKVRELGIDFAQNLHG